MDYTADALAHYPENALADGFLLVQLNAGLEPSPRVSLRCGSAELHRQQFYSGCVLRGRARPGRLILGWFEERSSLVTVAGRNLGSNRVFVTADDGIDICTFGSARFAWLEIESAEYAAELASILRGGARTSAGVSNPADVETIAALFTRAAEEDQPERDAIAAELAAEVKRLLQAISVSGEAAARTSRYEAIRAAEEFMWRHLDEPMSVGRIATAISRSERTVVGLFHSAFGMGPISYFKVQRLNAVRRELTLPPSGRNIIDIAADYSFWHMGHFGADYRRLFGETPTQTRRMLTV